MNITAQIYPVAASFARVERDINPTLSIRSPVTVRHLKTRHVKSQHDSHHSSILNCVFALLKCINFFPILQC